MGGYRCGRPARLLHDASGDVSRRDHSSLEAALESIKADEARHSENLGLAVMRKLLAGALCAHCGEPLGDGECGQDDDGRTMHEACLEKIGEDA